MAGVYIPTLHSFAMGNGFTGSDGLFRFRIVPTVAKIGKEVDYPNSSIHAEVWHGLYCYEKSTVEAEETFQMSDEGRSEMIGWLNAHNT